MKAVVPPCAFLCLYIDVPAFYRYRLTAQETSPRIIKLVVALAGERATADLQTPLK